MEKVALITGGSRGLGFENAKFLKALGFDLILVAKNPERLAAAKAELDQIGGGWVKTYSVDFANLSHTSEVLELISTEHNNISHLIIAHAVMSEKMSKTLKTTDEEWRRVLSTNLDSVFQVVNRLVPNMVEERNGRVVIYSACLGRMSGPGNTGGLAPYRVSKSGVNALVRNLAHETGLGSRRVLVDAVCPNHSRTDMGGPDAPRSAEEGAATALWLALREFDKTSENIKLNTTGVLWEDQEIVPW